MAGYPQGAGPLLGNPQQQPSDTAPFVIAAPCAGAAKRRLGLVVICENVNVRSSYVCGQVHCVLVRRSCMMLCVLMLAHRVMVLSLMVMMGRGVMMMH